MLLLVFRTTDYTWIEIDENHSGLISFSEIQKYFDTGKRFKCISNDDKVNYSYQVPQKECNKIFIEYYRFKDGIEFRLEPFQNFTFKKPS